MITIQCSDTGATLTIERIDDNTWHARVVAVGLQAETDVYAYMETQIASFFGQIARDWRGWEGVRIWGSLEGELELRLTIDRLGHVAVRVLLVLDLVRRSRAETILMVDAGQLDDIARMTKAFVED